jgi:cyclopropane fatty-acyl-phospholipid synthase-like methyltransferase
MPKDCAADGEEFYQHAYSEGFTTDCPSDEALPAVMEGKFAASAEHYQRYMSVLKAAGLGGGDLLLDFGASWGYGSWQLRQAGFRVYSYEISRQRADYARNRLSCEVIDRIESLPSRVRCFFPRT